jgi:hypothetical protein
VKPQPASSDPYRRRSEDRAWRKRVLLYAALATFAITLLAFYLRNLPATGLFFVMAAAAYGCWYRLDQKDTAYPKPPKRRPTADEQAVSRLSRLELAVLCGFLIALDFDNWVSPLRIARYARLAASELDDTDLEAPLAALVAAGLIWQDVDRYYTYDETVYGAYDLGQLEALYSAEHQRRADLLKKPQRRKRLSPLAERIV